MYIWQDRSTSAVCIRMEEEGMEDSIVPSKYNSRPRLGPQAILEGRSGKGSPRIKKGVPSSKGDRQDGAGEPERRWLTMAHLDSGSPH